MTGSASLNRLVNLTVAASLALSGLSPLGVTASNAQPESVAPLSYSVGAADNALTPIETKPGGGTLGARASAGAGTTDIAQPRQPVDLTALLDPGHRLYLPSVSARFYTAAQQVKPAAGGQLASPDGRINLDIPANAVDAPVTIQLQPRSAASAPGYLGTGLFFQFTAQDEQGQPVTQFRRDLQLTVRYEDEPGLVESRLALYYHSSAGWQPISSQADVERNLVTASVNHFTEFALLAPAQLHWVLNENVDLCKGTPIHASINGRVHTISPTPDYPPGWPVKVVAGPVSDYKGDIWWKIDRKVLDLLPTSGNGWVNEREAEFACQGGYPYNDWRVHQKVDLCAGTDLYAAAAAGVVQFTVPVDQWPATVIDGPVRFGLAAWWQIQPDAAGVSPGWVLQSQADSCLPGGGADTLAPFIRFVEVWPDGNGNLSLMVYITDTSGIDQTSLSLTGGPGTHTALIRTPQFGPDLYGATFAGIPNNRIVSFTVSAADLAGNVGELSGSSRSPFKRQYGASCPNDVSCGNPITLGRGNKVEPLALMSVAGPGDSTIAAVLTYNAQDSSVGMFGQGWTFAYQMTLEAHRNLLLDGVQVTYPDGRMVTFADQHDGTYASIVPDLHDRVEKKSGGYALITKALMTYEFSEAGRLLAVRDRNGNTITLIYSGDRLMRMENTAGRWVQFSYNPVGFVERLDAPEQKHVSFGYVGGRLDSFVDTRRQTWNFAYETRSIGQLLNVAGDDYEAVDYYLTSVITPKTHPKNEQRYDQLGRVFEQWIGGSDHRGFKYDEVARTTTVFDTYGVPTVYHFDELSRIVQVDYPNSTQEVFGYDADSNRTFYRDQAGREWHWTYDGRGNPLTERGPLGWQREWTYTPLDLPKAMTETVSLEPLTTRTFNFDYDDKGNLKKICNPIPTNAPDCATVNYGVYGLPADLTDFAGITTHNTYDPATGNLLATTNGMTETTRFSYDGLGRMVTLQRPLGVGATHVYTFTYSGSDKLKDIYGPLGYHLGYGYDANDNLEVVTDPDQGQTRYGYDARERLVSVTNPLTFTTIYTYGAMSELIGLQDAEQRIWSIEHNDGLLRTTDIHGPEHTSSHLGYDAAGNVTDQVDPNSRVTHTEFDDLNRPVTVTLNYRPGQPITIDTNVQTVKRYDVIGNLLREIDPLQNATVYQYDLLDRLILKRDAEDQEWTYGYDPLGHVTQITNPRQVTTLLGYDRAYRPQTLIQNYRPGLPTDASTNVQSERQYDANGNLIALIDPLGVVTRLGYDELDHLERQIRNYRPAFAADEKTNVLTRYQYDPAGKLRFVTDPRGFQSEQKYDAALRLIDTYDFAGAHTHFEYDRVDNLRFLTDDNQHQTTYIYDGLNRLTHVINPEGHAVQRSYDPAGNLVGLIDANQVPTHYDIDGLNRTRTVIQNYQPSRPAGADVNVTTGYTYDPMGNVLVETDPNGHTTSYAYDRVYRLLTLTDGEQNPSDFRWDKAGNLVKFIDGNRHPTDYVFDDLDRLISTTNANQETSQYGYDPLGNLTSLTEADATVTRYGFDPLYRLVDVTENYRQGIQPSADTNVKTQYRYDASGNLTNIIDANLHVTQFDHDGMGRVLTETNPISGTWTYTYDGIGNQLTRRDANGALTAYTYYPDDQLQQIAYSDGSSVGFSYDPNNNRTEMHDQLGTTGWAYDALNRVTRATDSLNRPLSYSYDPAGNRIGLRYPDGNVVSYSYLKNNWLQTMTAPEGNVTIYTHDGVGNILHIANPNDTASDIVYDPVNRVTSLTNKQIGGAGKTNSAFAYTYNKVGHVTQVIDEYGWRQPAILTEKYAYDGLHRLSGMQNSDGVVMSYSYDAVGNRLNWTSNDDMTSSTPLDGFATTYAYNAANGLLTASTTARHSVNDGTWRFQYDPNGNRINKEWEGPQGPPTQGTDYSYDSENRLISVQDYQLGGNRVDRALTTLSYDGGGRRLAQTYDPKTGGAGQKRTEYTFDGLDPVAEYSMLNGQRDDFYRGALGRMAVMQHFPAGTLGQMYWYEYNFKGDVSGLTKQSGQSTHNYRYDPYGVVIPDSGNFTDPHNQYTITGKELDDVTGLLFFGARYYDPSTGSWVTQDPYRGKLLDPMTLHRYEYVADNPVTWADLNGLEIDSNRTSADAQANGKYCSDHGVYNRSAVVEYARNHPDSKLMYISNSSAEYGAFGTDCANFVSQALKESGLPMTDEWYFVRPAKISGTVISVSYEVAPLISLRADIPTYLNAGGCRSNPTWWQPQCSTSWSSVADLRKALVEHYGFQVSEVGGIRQCGGIANTGASVGDVVFYYQHDTANPNHAAIIIGWGPPTVQGIPQEGQWVPWIADHTGPGYNRAINDVSEPAHKIEIVHVPDTIKLPAVAPNSSLVPPH